MKSYFQALITTKIFFSSEKKIEKTKLECKVQAKLRLKCEICLADRVENRERLTRAAGLTVRDEPL